MSTSQAYLRIGELARRTGVSPALLRAWEQRYGLLRPSRSPGGFRLYSDADEERVRRVKELIVAGVSASEAARRALEAPTRGAADTAEPLLHEISERLERALEALDGERANRAFDDLLAAFDVETVLRDALLPYLRRLGQRWEVGRVTVAQEHFASNLVRGRLLGLARGWGAGAGPALVLACPSGEWHDLPLIMFGIVVARRGRRVTFLGADTPPETIARTVRSVRPALVVLSVADPRRLEAHAEEIATLARECELAIGGSADPERIRELGARPLEGDPVEAARAITA